MEESEKREVINILTMIIKFNNKFFFIISR